MGVASASNMVDGMAVVVKTVRGLAAVHGVASWDGDALSEAKEAVNARSRLPFTIRTYFARKSFILNKPIRRLQRRLRWNFGFDGVGDSGEQKSLKRPEVGEDFPKVVFTDAEDSKEGVAECSLEKTARQPTVGLHMFDLRLDGAAPPQELGQ